MGFDVCQAGCTSGKTGFSRHQWISAAESAQLAFSKSEFQYVIYQDTHSASTFRPVPSQHKRVVDTLDNPLQDRPKLLSIVQPQRLLESPFLGFNRPRNPFPLLIPPFLHQRHSTSHRSTHCQSN